METISIQTKLSRDSIITFEKPVKVISFQVASNFEQVLNAPIFDFYPTYEEANEGEFAKILEITSLEVADYNLNKITQFDYINFEINKKMTNNTYDGVFLESGIYSVSVYNKNEIRIDEICSKLTIRARNNNNGNLQVQILINYEYL